MIFSPISIFNRHKKVHQMVYFSMFIELFTKFFLKLKFVDIQTKIERQDKK
jgi:hypothetical protein